MMVDLDAVLFPEGWTSYVGGPVFSRALTVSPAGFASANSNGPYALWKYTVSFRRSDLETQNELRIDDLYNFFLNRAASRAFLFKDSRDFAHNDSKATAHVELVEGAYKLTKHYPDISGSGYYTRLISRPEPGTIALLGGASGGTLNYTTGIVTGIASAGTWTGKHYVPCMFQKEGLELQVGVDGVVDALSVELFEIRI